MVESHPPLSKMMVETLIKGLEEAKNSIKSLQDQEHANELQLVEVRGKLENISGNVDEIKKLVKGNNGRDSMVDRVRTLEENQKTLMEFVKEYKDTKKEKTHGKWQLRAVWITSIMALLGSLGTALISLLY